MLIWRKGRCGVFAGNSVWSTSERLVVKVLTIGAIQVHFLFFSLSTGDLNGQLQTTLLCKGGRIWETVLDWAASKFSKIKRLNNKQERLKCLKWQSHCAGTTRVEVTRRTAWKVTLQAATVDRQRWSEGDMTRQTVPDTGSSDRKSSVADSRQPCTTDG